MTASRTARHRGHSATHEVYALSCAEYERLVARAAGRCERCGRQSDPKRLVIDHDHDHPYGHRAVRGLLCVRCNIVLGKVDRGVWPLDDLTSAYLLKPFHRHIPAKRVGRVSPVVSSRSQGVARRSFRHDDEATWQRFMALAEPDASEALRQFVDWYTRKPKAKMPRRPSTQQEAKS